MSNIQHRNILSYCLLGGVAVTNQYLIKSCKYDVDSTWINSHCRPVSELRPACADFRREARAKLLDSLRLVAAGLTLA